MRDGSTTARIVSAAGPNFGTVRRSLDQRSPRQALQAARPFDVLQTPFDGLFLGPARIQTPERCDGYGAIGNLMPPDELWQGEIEEASAVDDAEHTRLMAKAEADGIEPTFATD